MRVKDLMTKEVFSVKPDDSIRKVAELLIEHHISGVPVVDEKDKVCGIITESDLMRKRIAPQLPDQLCILGSILYYNGLSDYQKAFKKFSAMSAGQLMTEDVVTTTLGEDVKDAAKKMLDKHLKVLPVVDYDGRLQGVLSRRDIVRLLLEEN